MTLQIELSQGEILRLQPRHWGSLLQEANEVFQGCSVLLDPIALWHFPVLGLWHEGVATTHDLVELITWNRIAEVPNQSLHATHDDILLGLIANQALTQKHTHGVVGLLDGATIFLAVLLKPIRKGLLRDGLANTID